VFVVEVGGILVVEAAPAAGVAASNVSAAAANVNATVTVAGEVYIGWQNIYQFISGFVNTNAPPVTPAAYLGNMAGKAFRGLTSR